MAFSSLLVLFAVAASAVVFWLTRKRVGLGGAAALSFLTFFSIAGASIVWLQVSLAGMNGG